MIYYDKIKSYLYDSAKSAVANIDYFGQYTCKVISQSSDYLKVDIQPQDNRVPGINSVPIFIGVPGITAQIQPGAICILSFQGGNPSLPFVYGFSNEDVLSLTITASTTVNIGGSGGDNVATKQDITALITAIGSSLTSVSGGAVSWTTPPVATCSQVVKAKR